MLSCPGSLVTDFPQGVRECREPELGLEELLRHRIQLLQQHEEYQVPPAGPLRASCSALALPAWGERGARGALQGNKGMYLLLNFYNYLRSIRLLTIKYL